jgi:hypothetical protein
MIDDLFFKVTTMENALNYFDFPEDILCSFLMEWTDIVDVICLDTSMCNRTFRERFLELISKDTFIHNGSSVIRDEKLISWIENRSVKVYSIYLSPQILFSGHIGFQNLSSVKVLKSFYCPALIIFLKSFQGQITELDLSMDSVTGEELKSDIQITDIQLEEILSLLTHLKKINLEGCTAITNRSVSRVHTFCAAIEMIKLCGCYQLTSKVHIILFSKLQLLRQIEFCCFKGKITDKDLKICFSNCQFVERLVIKECDIVTDDSICILANHCHNLVYLEITFGILISDISLCQLVNNNGNLKHLLLHDCKVSDHFFLVLGETCKFMEELYVENCRHITNVGLSCIANSLLKLKTFSISGSNTITDFSIMMIARNCTKLNNVNLSGNKKITELSAAEFIQYCPYLTNFGFNKTKIKMDFVFQKYASINNFTNLSISFGIEFCEEYNVTLSIKKNTQFIEFYSGSPNISTSILHDVLLSCPMLLSLSLQGHDRLLDKHFIGVFEYCEQLKSIKLLGNSGLTVSTIRRIGAVCKHLTHFHVSHFSDLKDDILCAFFCAQSSLENVSIKLSEQISDASMNVLARVCSKTLQQLCITGSPLITPLTTDVMRLQCNLIQLSINE